MLRNVAKFGGIALLIALLGIGVLYGIQYWRYRSSPEYRVLQDLKNIERQYAEDSYGGETPEETLRLFIEALKNGDTDLAAKYFVLDKQEEWREDLVKIKEKGLLKDMIRDAEKLNSKYPLIDGDNNRFIFEAFNENGELILQADIAKGPNGKWKIVDL